MKFIPLLFSTPMVQAILEGRKTMTRRLVKAELDDRGLRTTNVPFEDWHGKEIKCPYGQPGDVLYVREMHYRFGHWIEDGISKTGKQKWKFVADSKTVLYFDDPPASNWKSLVEFMAEGYPARKNAWYKRNSLFMPKSACRIFLQNKGVDAERLHIISDADAALEGVLRADLFRELWKSINGAESWNANPLVWVISFKKIERPAGFLTGV